MIERRARRHRHGPSLNSISGFHRLLLELQDSVRSSVLRGGYLSFGLAYAQCVASAYLASTVRVQPIGLSVEYACMRSQPLVTHSNQGVFKCQNVRPGVVHEIHPSSRTLVHFTSGVNSRRKKAGEIKFEGEERSPNSIVGLSER